MLVSRKYAQINKTKTSLKLSYSMKNILLYTEPMSTISTYKKNKNLSKPVSLPDSFFMVQMDNQTRILKL